MALLVLLLAGCSSTPPPAPLPPALAEARHAAEVAARHSRQGNWTAAAAAWESAADRYALLNRQADQALALHNVSVARRQSGQLREARAPLLEAARINDSLGRRTEWWRNQISLVQLEIALKETNEVRRLWDVLEPRSQEITDPATRALFLNERGLWQLAQGHPDQASAAFEEALAHFQSLKDFSGQATAQANLARTREQQDNLPAALAAWQSSLASFETAGEPHGIATALAGQGRVLAAQGKDLAQARDLLERAARNFERLRAPAEAGEIRNLLQSLTSE